MENTEKFKKSPAHIRFHGTLRDNLSFTLKPGWETHYIAHRPHQFDFAESSKQEDFTEETYRVELLTEKDIPILSRLPEIKNVTSCEKSARASEVFEVTAYLPLHREARSLIFRRGNYTIYKREISPEPPQIKISSIKIEENKGSINWEAKHQKNFPLHFNVGVVLEKKRVFLLAKLLDKTTFSLDFTNIPGSDEAYLVVLASDGLRSSFDTSKSFKIPEKEFQLFISQPKENEIFASGQPIPYNGRALDIGGTNLPKKQLIWRLDEEIISRSEFSGVLNSIQPGSHTLRLEWVEGDKISYSQEINFEVASPSKKQIYYQKLIHTYLEEF